MPTTTPSHRLVSPLNCLPRRRRTTRTHRDRPRHSRGGGRALRAAGRRSSCDRKRPCTPLRRIQPRYVDPTIPFPLCWGLYKGLIAIAA
ncbi:hypothetical protein K469DRAFT_57936 [Zopfia rhizophila CBS 207.26]|uniref:Uncharacterized protein n=1 Tax=Zopfia rhizophila CBS 207.26 TaxID=1314779 RepID=A0A6A6EG79_9PEZI|nr:hypothetical protein K469DRAFT_57936 [Zopfia rhizophila CBS 207.26]